jgi:hypothetical protein
MPLAAPVTMAVCPEMFIRWSSWLLGYDAAHPA